MGRRSGGNNYRGGSFWRVCDRSGFTVRADRTRKEWNGKIVRDQSFEMRQPQDFVKGVVDYQAVPDPRPVQALQFINQGNGQGEIEVYGDQTEKTFLVENNQGPSYNTGTFPGTNVNPNGTAEYDQYNGTVPAVTPASLNQSMNRGPGSE